QQLQHDKFQFNKEIMGLDYLKRKIFFANQETLTYDFLISTIPIDKLLTFSNFEEKRKNLASRLVHNSIYIIGVGLNGQPPENLKTKCWIYFPEETFPFHRITIFSNYSCYNVPKPNQQWSIMVEVSNSPYKNLQIENLKERVVHSLEKAGYINTKDV